MATNVESAPEPVLLIIADISGYTGYMTANAKALAHGQALIWLGEPIAGLDDAPPVVVALPR